MTDNYQSVFRRYEKKYMLDQKQFRQISRAIAGHMEPDRYGRYSIGNLYYDTADYGLIRASLEKPVYKEKLRIRSYEVPKADDPVFVEIKKKYKGVVYKRRISMAKARADECLAMAGKENWQAGAGGPFARAVGEKSPDYQIACELDWFLRYYRPHPAVYLAYDRTAWSSEENPGLRITFDTRIRYRQERLDLSAGDDGQLLQEDGHILMEVKIPGTMPLWLAQALSGYAIYPISFSKYGTCYRERLAPAWIQALCGEEYESGVAAEEMSRWTGEAAADYNMGGIYYA